MRIGNVDFNTPLPISEGGTGATTASQARINLEIPSGSGGTVRQTFSNTDVTVNSTTTLLAHTGNQLTSLRTITLPTGVSAGHTLIIVDESGRPSWWYPLRIVASSALINGRESIDISIPYQQARLIFDGLNWTASISNPTNVSNPTHLNDISLYAWTPLFSAGSTYAGFGLNFTTSTGGTNWSVAALENSSGGASIRAGSGPASSDRAFIQTSESYLFPVGLVRLFITATIDRINNGTDNLVYSFGFRDNFTSNSGLSPIDGVYFNYGDTNNPNTANWTMTTASNNSRTRVSTEVPATTGAISFGIEIIPTSADFFIDNTNVGRITSNIPTGVNRTSAIVCGANRLLGSTNLGQVITIRNIHYYLSTTF